MLLPLTRMESGACGDAMAVIPPTSAVPGKPDRRRFLWSLATFGLTTRIAKPDEQSDAAYRILTPVCEVRMSVQHFASSSMRGLRFRDDLLNRSFCLSARGEQDRDCLERFVGSIAIAHYHFRSRRHTTAPLKMRERVLTIDHDSRIRPRAPFERVLAVERAAVSDIQAFGYNTQDAGETASDAGRLAVWYLVRQDLYLNDQTTAFLVVHWKHTLDVISLLDVIPGDGTRVIAD